MPLNNPQTASGKAARLHKWGDADDNADADDDIFGGHDDFLAQLNSSRGELLSPIDEGETLKMPRRARGLSPGAGDVLAVKNMKHRNSVNNLKHPPAASAAGNLARYIESDERSDDGDFDFAFGEQIRMAAGLDQKNRFAEGGLRFLPGSASLTSPARRLSLGEYSEDTDTDITDINDGDFEEIDDIFGKEESGIYSSGGTRALKKLGTTRAREVLLQRRQQMEKEAQAEDEDLFQRFQEKGDSRMGKSVKHGFGGLGPFVDADEVNTLKLRDLRLFESGNGPLPTKRGLGSERDADFTVNYEYTKDDFESFEDGFVGDLPAHIRPDKLAHFHSSAPETATLLHKTSMPVFPRSLKAAKPTKFKSTMDLASAFGGSAEHPVFNPQNKLIRKLDRMPSFHIKKTSPPSPVHEDLLDYNMELHKKQLLERYMEILEKQFQLRSSPRKGSSNPQKAKKGVGIVRYLNLAAAPHGSGNKNMTFNVDAKTWEGNEHDLLRFEEKDEHASKTLKQPSLITLLQFRDHKSVGGGKGSMVYDAENLRWVNKDAAAELQENVFDNLPDLEPNDIPAYAAVSTSASAAASASASKPKPNVPDRADRGVSTFTQRTVLTVSNGSTVASNAGEEFALSAKLMAKFEKEEAKVRKKTHHWFGPGESYHLSSRHGFDPDYFWEIRKMVMDNDA